MSRSASPMLRQLQRRTMMPLQVMGYALTMFVGVAIVLLAVQLYADLRPALTEQTDVFGSHAITMSKNIGAMHALNKRGIYFSDSEIDELRSQPFVREVARFTSSNFRATASVSVGGQGLYTDLFFESVPDRFVDVQSELWQWDTTSDLLPVIIPEDYLSLYNFGFAESQSLPVVSAATLEQVTFTVTVGDRTRYRSFRSRIVGLSGKINTILAPETFLQWANRNFGDSSGHAASRLLVEFRDPADSRIPAFVEEHGYHISQSELESSRLMTFFRLAMLAVLAVAAIIIALSAAFLVMSFHLIVQRNRKMFTGLYHIGYAPRKIARFYRQMVTGVTVAVIMLDVVAVALLRQFYVARLSTVFSIEGSLLPLAIGAVVLSVLLVFICRAIVLRTVKRTVLPSQHSR